MPAALAAFVFVVSLYGTTAFGLYRCTMRLYRITYTRPDMPLPCIMSKWARSSREAIALAKKVCRVRCSIVSCELA